MLDPLVVEAVVAVVIFGDCKTESINEGKPENNQKKSQKLKPK